MISNRSASFHFVSKTLRWAIVGALLTPAARAACDNWDVQGGWRAIQDDGIVPFFLIRVFPARTVFLGIGNFWSPERFWGNVFYDYRSPLLGVTTRIGGSTDNFKLTKDSLSFSVNWTTGKRSWYRGNIGPQGSIEGTTGESLQPASQRWHSDRPLECRRPTVFLGKVKISGTAAPISICDAARGARGRNSPAAPGLERQCHAADLQARPSQEARGQVLALQDPLATALRNRQAVGDGQRGFDIGLAAAEGQTAPGPDNQHIHDALALDEKPGFEAAVAFSLERNRNGDLAARGAAVSAADPEVAAAHNAESDVFYWLGFDIATGIFGAPALGGKGEAVGTAESLAIRDALSAAGQRGFNAAMSFHSNRPQ